LLYNLLRSVYPIIRSKKGRGALKELIKILAVGDPAVDVYVDEEFNILSEYEKEKDIKVLFDVIQWEDYYETLIKAFETGEYDIVMVAGHLWLKDFVSRNWLLPIEPRANEDYDYDDILPLVRDEIVCDRESYLYPSFCDGHILLYRKSKLDASNIKISQVISIDEMIEVVKKLSRYSKTPFVLKSHISEIFTDFLPYLRSEGIEPFDAKGIPQFNNARGVKALKKYIELKRYCPDDTNEYGNEEIKEAIQNRAVDMAVTWSGQLGQVMNEDCIEREDIEFAMLNTGWNTTWCFGINSKTEKKDECIAFLEYLTSKKIDRLVGSYCGCPVRKSTLKEGIDRYRWYSILLNMLENSAKPLPKLSHSGEIIGAVADEIYNAFIGLKSPKEAIEKAEKEVMKIIGD